MESRPEPEGIKTPQRFVDGLKVRWRADLNQKGLRLEVSDYA